MILVRRSNVGFTVDFGKVVKVRDFKAAIIASSILVDRGCGIMVIHPVAANSFFLYDIGERITLAHVKQG
jgi:hypothetical protein